MYALLWSKSQIITILPNCRTDPVDFLNPETLIFPMVYKMSLCKFFPGGLNILQDCSFCDVCLIAVYLLLSTGQTSGCKEWHYSLTIADNLVSFSL